MNKMNIEKIKQRIQKFSDDRNWDEFHNPKNLVMALNGEVGELNEIFQWLNFEECMNLPDDVKINGVGTVNECKLNSVIHRSILEKAVQFALTSKLGTIQK